MIKSKKISKIEILSFIILISYLTLSTFILYPQTCDSIKLKDIVKDTYDRILVKTK